MDLLRKIDLVLQDQIASGATTSGNVAINTAKGSIDVIGGKCPEGQVYDKIKKVCVPSKNESSISGMVAGSQQTRIWGSNVATLMPDLNRKNPVKGEMADKTKENLSRKSLRFNKLTGAYVPELWGEDG